MGAVVLATLAGAAVGALARANSGHALQYAALFGGLGGGLPCLSVREATRSRRAVISRELPLAIDGLALAVSAGLDFPGAIRQVVETPHDGASPLVDELARVLEALSLGATRREALLAFADRVPVPGVVEFVQAMVQAEEKGNPVMDVLLVQAQESRMKRSARAEEAASRAGVALAFPLFLMFGCTMLIVLGPIILNVPRGLGTPIGRESLAMLNEILTTLVVNVQYPEGRTEKVIADGPRILVGSGAHCDVCLPLGAAASEHIEVLVGENGELFVHALADEPRATLAGAPFRRERLRPGAVLKIGALGLNVEQAQDGA